MTDTPSSGRPLVFFVSSEPDFAECTRIFLEDSGYRVRTADGTSREAIAASVTLAHDLHPHLIILGVATAMLDALHGLRSDPATLTTPIIVLRGVDPGDPRIVECRELAEAYLQFPLDFGDLLHLVDRLLGRMSPKDGEDLAAWRRLRFSEDPSPEAVVEYLGPGHYPAAHSEAQALLREMGAEALPALVRVLNDSAQPYAWRTALELIAVLAEARSGGCHEAVAAMAALLAHPDRERRWRAFECLYGHHRRGPGALSAIVDKGAPVMAEVTAALDADDRELQSAAIEALGRLCTPEALVALRAFLPRADDEHRAKIEERLRFA